LDGYPRTIEQAEHMLKLFPRGTLKAFYIDIDDKIVEDRIVNRLVCKNCSAPFSKIAPNQPIINGTCDHCNGELYQRVDDNLDVIKTRLNEYNTKTLPILEYLKNEIEIIPVPKDCNDIFEFVLENS
ncbi:adenylate kinase family protein, partial [Vibrio splendidus]